MSTRFAFSIGNTQQVRALASTEVETTNSNPIFKQNVSFSDIISDKSLRNELSNSGFTVATDIQVKAFSQIVSGKDVIIGAETGSGKTLSYVLPLLSRYAITNPNNKKTRGLILAPTNDLCNQIFSMSAHLFSAVSTEGKLVALGSLFSDSTPSKMSKFLLHRL